MLISSRMICLNKIRRGNSSSIWAAISPLFARANLEKVVISHLLLPSGFWVLINLCIAHLLPIIWIKHVEICVEKVFQVIWILYNLLWRLCHIPPILLNFLRAACNRWLSLLLTLVRERVHILLLGDVLVVNDWHLGQTWALVDATAVVASSSTLLRHNGVRVLNLGTK
jgi:hypothetical protein